jgi:hypothetical protein
LCASDSGIESMLRVAISQPAPAERHTMAQGARFEVHIEKARGNHGEHVKPFDARLETRDGTAAWTMKDVEDAGRLRVAALLATWHDGARDRRGDRHRQIGGARMKQRINREAKEAAAEQDEGE